MVPAKGLFTPKTRVFSAAEILLRIYQNPIHLFKLGPVGGSVKFADGKTSSANVPHLNVWGFDNFEFPQQKKTRVFGVNRPSAYCVPPCGKFRANGGTQ